MKIISDEKQLREERVFTNIKEVISKRKSFVLDAGAGSGKTYTLIEALKYLILENERRLKQNNQRILCITYTNVAVKEINERLGNSNLVYVSTIHEAIWDIIKGYQTKLLEIHRIKLTSEIEKMKDENDSITFYKELIDKQDFEQKIENMKEEFWQVYSRSAADFRIGMEKNDIPSELLINVVKFKKVVQNIYKINKYIEASEKMDTKENNSITYDARYNTDSLQYMRISHDTLLEYAKNLIKSNEIIQQIISNQFPFVFVDEYQDTSSEVVNILAKIDLHVQKSSNTFLVGYFGDKKQKIYGNGIGDMLLTHHPKLEQISKEYNRRSQEKVIELGNAIRDDDIQQMSIYDEHSLGAIDICLVGNLETSSLIKKYKVEWGINETNKLFCLELKNEAVASNNGFEEIYDFLRRSPKYEGSNYNNLNTQVLSIDDEKLAPGVRVIKNILSLRKNVMDKKTMLQSILPVTTLNDDDSTFLKLREVIKVMQSIDGKTLYEYLQSLIDKINEAELEVQYICRLIVESLFGNQKISLLDNRLVLEDIINYMYTSFGGDKQSDDRDFRDEIINFLNIKIEIFEKYHSFLDDRNEGNIIHKTIHGTKGLEYDNIIIILDDNFARDREYFSRLFTKNIKELAGREHTKYCEAQNLLYVGVTRAKKNLAIIYPGNIKHNSPEFQRIFDENYTKIVTSLL